jgi:hypothetical protein
MVVRRSFTALITSLLVMAGLVLSAAGPARAATRYGSFWVGYGQSYVQGTVSFFNQSVRFVGTVRATPGNCRAMEAATHTVNHGELDWTADNYAAICASTTSLDKPFDFTLQANITGGASHIVVALYGHEANDGLPYQPLTFACETYPNQGCTLP